jgi:hypothetical protein
MTTTPMTDAFFPPVNGRNLDRQKLNFPSDFAGELNVVLLAFKQWHQKLVDTWLPTAEALEAEIPGLVYYELPTIRALNRLSQVFVNEGMRAGIANPKARQRTITLYLDIEPFIAKLGLPSEQNDIFVLLVASDGRVLWWCQGEYTAVKENALRTAVAAAHN